MKWVVSALVVFIIFGCQKENVLKEKTTKSLESKKVKSLSIISDEKEGLKGKIEIYENNPEVYFVLNWESKSKITYKVLNADDFNLKDKKGKVLKVEGKIKKLSQWSGEIEILKIIELYE